MKRMPRSDEIRMAGRSGVACFVVIAAALLCYWLGPWPQLMYLYLVQDIAKETPLIFVTPQPLTPKEEFKGIKLQVVRYGYSFELPIAKATGSREWTNASIWQSNDGLGILFFAPSEKDNVASMLRQAENQGGQATALLGRDTLRTEFSLIKAALESTPLKQSLWQTRLDAIRNGTLVMDKRIYVRKDGPHKIFEVHIGEFNGFQLGDPAIDTVITIILYDKADRRLEFTLSRKKISETQLSQAALNLIFQSI